MYEDHTDLLAVTDHRLLSVEEGLTRKRLEEFHYSPVSSVHRESGMLMAEIKIFAPSNTAVINLVAPKERAQEIASYASRCVAESSGAHSPQPSTPQQPRSPQHSQHHL
jgi:hypothetical protein